MENKMKKKDKIELKSITLNNGTLFLPKPIYLDPKYRHVEVQDLLIEVLRLECEALTGEQISMVYDETNSEDAVESAN